MSELSVKDWEMLAQHYLEQNKQLQLTIDQYKAAFELLEAEEAFIGCHHEGHSPFEPGQEKLGDACKGKEHHPVFCLLMNDIFDYASADAEELPPERWIEVRDVYKKYGSIGLIVWTSIRRGYEPLKPIADKPEYQEVRKNILDNDEVKIWDSKKEETK